MRIDSRADKYLGRESVCERERDRQTQRRHRETGQRSVRQKVNIARNGYGK